MVRRINKSEARAWFMPSPRTDIVILLTKKRDSGDMGGGTKTDLEECRPNREWNKTESRITG
ncbi:hypothetical protein [Eudoraea sp.]|uniref:hypothetical protein n=1 Tax=Eudoraea sp. TaxID=1979955 RepID=UPI003C74623D